MIRISRPAQAPGVLLRLGAEQTKRDCEAYDLQPDDYKSGAANFAKKPYYNDRAVKDVLVGVHYHKCCYCETKFQVRAYLHVEHFRPKSGVRQDRAQQHDERPGYYWLAYHWENLLLSCYACNCDFKRTLFPLEDPKDRARSHHDDITMERPLLIDPAAEDPRDHIRFYDDFPKGITPRGDITIDTIGLRRPQLREERVALLQQIRIYQQLVALAANTSADNDLAALANTARMFLEAAALSGAEFSSMATDYLAFGGTD